MCFNIGWEMNAVGISAYLSKVISCHALREPLQRLLYPFFHFFDSVFAPLLPGSGSPLDFPTKSTWPQYAHYIGYYTWGPDYLTWAQPTISGSTKWCLNLPPSPAWSSLIVAKSYNSSSSNSHCQLNVRAYLSYKLSMHLAAISLLWSRHRARGCGRNVLVIK